ncbi:MAG: sigma factor-like helix-turn-helix DNA-binding protein [Candidatus Hydrothermarchaeales archaeon]
MLKRWYKGFFTKKEFEALRLRKEGLTQKEIAIRLGISQPHVSQILSTIDDKVRRSKETLGAVFEDQISLKRKKRNPDELRVFCRIVRGRVKKNVKYGDKTVVVEPW